MLLKIVRSQRTGGIISETAIFCLNARVEFTPHERQCVARYKLHGQVIYNSEAQKRAAEGASMAVAAARGRGVTFGSVDDFLTSSTSKLGHGLKAAALGAISALRLTITIGSLERGHQIECKSLDELLGAEEAILSACESLKGYLDTAMTFDGTEVVIDFATGKPEVVAETTPRPALAAAPPPPAPRLAAPEGRSEEAIVDTPFLSYDPLEEEAIVYEDDNAGAELRAKIIGSVLAGVIALIFLFVILR